MLACYGANRPPPSGWALAQGVPRLAWLIAVLVFGLLIAFHELGHMWAARRMGMRVERYSIGFGPAVLRWRRGETEYVLGALPLGGYVAISGMAGDEEPAEDGTPRPPDPRSFNAKKPWQQGFVLAAGPLANYLLAFLIGVPLLMGTTTRPDHESTRIGVVEAGSPAAAGGLLPGDVVREVGGVPVQGWASLTQALGQRHAAAPEQPVELRIERGAEQLVLPISFVVTAGRPRIGIGPAEREIAGIPFAGAVTQAAHNLVLQSLHSAQAIGRMITGRSEVQLSGPIGILGYTADQAQKGARSLLQTIWLLSVAIGFFNLLPIPALDGGRLVFVAYEVLTRRRVDQRVAGWIHAGGLVALLVLLLVVSYGDIARRFGG